MNQSFLDQLQAKAQEQAKLNQTRILPAQFDEITSLIGRYPWQSLVLVSFLGAALWEVIGPWIW
jgi:hypothetical protein